MKKVAEFIKENPKGTIIIALCIIAVLAIIGIIGSNLPEVRHSG